MDLTKIDQILKDFMKKTDMGRRIKKAKVFTIWKDTVGLQIARASHPIKYDEGILYVAVTDSVWMDGLSYQKESIRGKLNGQLEDDQQIDEIKLVLSRGERKKK
ncbi:DUF721 domain-containing protein [Candidatus Hydrogenedentota bacterium]